MQLLGAGRWFIALPFVIGGLLVSSVASVTSWMVIVYGQRQLDFVKITISLPQISDIVLFCAITGALGAISGYYGVRRHLE
jgi:cell division protein FtsX